MGIYACMYTEVKVCTYVCMYAFDAEHLLVPTQDMFKGCQFKSNPAASA